MHVMRATLEALAAILVLLLAYWFPIGIERLSWRLIVGAVLGSTPPHATLAYGQPLTVSGFHVVQTDSDHWVENLAGLGGCGAQVFLGFVGDTPQQGHPMLPVLQIAEEATLPAAATADVDVVFTADGDANLALLHRLLTATARGAYTPVASAGGFVDFQLSRGLLGVST